MFSRFGFAFLFLFSCAKSNYQNSISNRPDTAKDFSNCTLILSKLDQCVNLNWVKFPTDSEMGVFNLDFSSSIALTPKVILWMPSMGHGSRPTTVTRLSPTQFQISDVAFIMPGEWEIRIRFLESNQVIDEVSQKITY